MIDREDARQRTIENLTQAMQNLGLRRRLGRVPLDISRWDIPQKEHAKPRELTASEKLDKALSERLYGPGSYAGPPPDPPPPPWKSREEERRRELRRAADPPFEPLPSPYLMNISSNERVLFREAYTHRWGGTEQRLYRTFGYHWDVRADQAGTSSERV